MNPAAFALGPTPIRSGAWIFGSSTGNRYELSMCIARLVPLKTSDSCDNVRVTPGTTSSARRISLPNPPSTASTISPIAARPPDCFLYLRRAGLRAELAVSVVTDSGSIPPLLKNCSSASSILYRQPGQRPALV